jgi:hypothetical protein
VCGYLLERAFTIIDGIDDAPPKIHRQGLSHRHLRALQEITNPDPRQRIGANGCPL